jgi:hypothetical protein
MRVFLAAQPTDMRRSFDGLVALTRSALLQGKGSTKQG